jgi:hypothetical protein
LLKDSGLLPWGKDCDVWVSVVVKGVFDAAVFCSWDIRFDEFNEKLFVFVEFLWLRLETEGFDVEEKTFDHAGDDGVDNALAWIVGAESEKVFSCDKGLNAGFVCGGEVVVRRGQGFNRGQDLGGDVDHTIV